LDTKTYKVASATALAPDIQHLQRDYHSDTSEKPEFQQANAYSNHSPTSRKVHDDELGLGCFQDRLVFLHGGNVLDGHDAVFGLCFGDGLVTVDFL
jgi:hypothetical protein